MYNPMTTEDVKNLRNKLSPLQLAFLDAVNDFAYETTQPLESDLGEYARSNYSKDKLFEAICVSIRNPTVNEGGEIGYKRLRLLKAIADAGFNPQTISVVEDTVEAEAKKRIDKSSSIKDGVEICHIGNGHHGRQYIAASSVESLARRYCSCPS